LGHFMRHESQRGSAGFQFSVLLRPMQEARPEAESSTVKVEHSGDIVHVDDSVSEIHCPATPLSGDTGGPNQPHALFRCHAECTNGVSPLPALTVSPTGPRPLSLPGSVGPPLPPLPARPAPLAPPANRSAPAPLPPAAVADPPPPLRPCRSY